MPLDCSNVPSNVSYSCSNPCGQHCTDAKHFDFNSLWSYTLSIQGACPNDSRLFIAQGTSATPENAALTQASCFAVAGANWQWYATADIYSRLTTWKFPLLQLVASFPRPPLGLGVQFFVLAHVLGDPIDTIKCLLLKLSNCQRLAEYWMDYHPQPRGISTNDEDREKLRDWKALMLLTDTYGEWGEESRAAVALRYALCYFKDGSEEKRDLKDAIHRTADALAGDRATAFLPIIVAETFFVGAIAIAVARTASAASISSDTVYINVEAHSIAISALYFWIIPAVILSSVIGVSQTEAAIPRILKRIQHKPPLSHPEKLAEVITCINDDRRMAKEKLAELRACLDDQEMKEKRFVEINECLDNDRTKRMEELTALFESLDHRSKALKKVTELNESLDGRRRLSHGGIYSWQPYRCQWETSENARTATPLKQGEQTQRSRDRSESQGLCIAGHVNGSLFASENRRHALPAYLIVVLGTMTGMIISGLVPPDGPDCRHIGELLICVAWILSAWLDTRFNYMMPLRDISQGSKNKVSKGSPERTLEHKQNLLFRWTATKDIVISIATLGGVIAVQVGVLNRCSCYTMWGYDGLALPEMPIVYEKLRHRLSTWYPGLAFTCIGMELLIVPALIYRRYPDAFRVYLQRDDGEPNLKWLHKPVGWLRTSFSLKSVRNFKRSRILTMEEAQDSGEKFQMQSPEPKSRNSARVDH